MHVQALLIHQSRLQTNRLTSVINGEQSKCEPSRNSQATIAAGSSNNQIRTSFLCLSLDFAEPGPLLRCLESTRSWCREFYNADEKEIVWFDCVKIKDTYILVTSIEVPIDAL